MQKYRFIRRSFIIILIIIIATTSCWNRRELETLGIVFGMGIDKAVEPEKLQLSTQIILPGKIGGPEASGGSEEKPYFNISSKGETVFDAIRAMSHHINRKLYLSHNEIIVLSQEIAKDGVQGIIDLFLRDSEGRSLVYILVTKGKAEEILESKAQLEPISALNIAELIENQGATSEAIGVTIKDFIDRLMSKTTAPIATLIGISTEEKGKIPVVEGTAVFKKDKLVGYLNKVETRGLLWVIKKVKSGIIVIDCPGGDGKASLEIIRAKSEITPEIKGDSIHFSVKITEEGNLGSQTCFEDLTTTSVWKELEKKQNDAIRNEIMQALKKAQELNADIFGFGEAINRKFPKVWKEIEDQWDEYFPELEVTVVVDSKLRRSGMINKTVTSE